MTKNKANKVMADVIFKIGVRQGMVRAATQAGAEWNQKEVDDLDTLGIKVDRFIATGLGATEILIAAKKLGI